MRKYKQNGFTLIELTVVVAIMGILASVILPQTSRLVENAKIAACKSETKSIMLAIISYRDNVGHYPNACGPRDTYSYCYQSASILNNVLMTAGALYLQHRIALDPWKNEYSYHTYVETNPYADVVFYGNGPDRTNSSWDGGLWMYGRFGGDDIGEITDGI